MLSRSISITSRRTRGVTGSEGRYIDPVTGTVRRRTPGAPPPDPQENAAAAACKTAILQGELPETIFKSRLQSGTLSRPVAAVCLIEADSRNQIDAGLGQLALDWLWDERANIIHPDDNDLMHALVRLLMREGQEEAVWRWMGTKSLRSWDLPRHIRFEWRSTLLKAFVMFKAQSSTDMSLDESLKAYLHAKSTVFVLFGGADTWLQSQLDKVILLRKEQICATKNGGRRWLHHWPNIDESLWEALLLELGTERPLYKFGLDMYNPRRPNPYPT